MSDEFNIQLGTTQTIMKPQHSDNCLDELDTILRNLSNSELCALYSVTTVCKSLSIGMAVIKRFITVDEAVLAARTEEEYQIKLFVEKAGIWGPLIIFLARGISIIFQLYQVLSFLS